MAREEMLDKLLAKHKVDDKVKAYLLSKDVVTLGQFAGLADDKRDVGEGLCTPRGLDVTDRILCQPVECAWQEAKTYMLAEFDKSGRAKSVIWMTPSLRRCASRILTTFTSTTISAWRRTNLFVCGTAGVCQRRWAC